MWGAMDATMGCLGYKYVYSGVPGHFMAGVVHLERSESLQNLMSTVTARVWSLQEYGHCKSTVPARV